MSHRSRSRGRVVAVALLAAALLGTGSAVAEPSPSPRDLTGPTLPLNDLELLLSLTADQLTEMRTPVVAPGPRLAATPRARCDAGSRPLAGVQGRVPASALRSPAARRGWTCNTRPVARSATPGGWRVWRFTDAAGRTCAYYDTSFTAPANIISVAGGPSLGVMALDMSNPSRPRRTAVLRSPGMLSPHESLNLNARRGLLVAATGNAATTAGTMDVYDVKRDCRHPRLRSVTPIATGHESGFSPDGRTYWVAGGAGYIYAFDLTNPSRPREVWKGAYYSHGLEFSRDGRTAFQTDPINGNVGLLDVSEIQDRRPDPEVRDLSRITWGTVSIPQNSVPFRREGRDYLLEFDEFAFRFNPATVAHKVGAARIIDIENPRRPRIVSDLRLGVQMRDQHRRASGDPYPLAATSLVGYGMHYCNVPTRVNPSIVACSALNSGLRIFDISDLRHPREVGYFVAPARQRLLDGLLPGNLATAQPAFDPARRTVWYSDAGGGLYVVRLTESAWPRAGRGGR